MSIIGGSIYPLSIARSIDDADWGWTEIAGGGSLGVRAATTVARSLSPSECYELVVGVRRAVTAIVNNVVQARPRLFTRTGREVTGGRPYEFIHRPFPRMSWARWCREWVEHWLIYGEHAAWLRKDDRGLRAEVLNPSRLSVKRPTRVNRRDDVQLWEYRLPSGSRAAIPDGELVFDRMPNSNDPVRGLSPLVTGSTQAGLSHYAGLYNQAFFQNDTVPRGMMKVPNMGQSRLEDFERQFRERFGSDGAARVNYHKILFAVTSGEIEWIPFERGNESANLETQKWAFELIGSLYGVPPVEMQNLQKTRFDTADIERKLFAESTIMPMLEQFTAELQIQCIEPFFAGERVETTSPSMNKYIAKAFERARTVSAGDIVLLLDPDTMPVMASVKAGLIDLAAKFRTALGASPQETVEFFGIDLPVRDERMDVYMPKTEWNVTRPSQNPEVIVADRANAAKEAKPTATPPDDESKRARRRSLGRLVRSLRVLTLDRMFPRSGRGELWSLNEADAINEHGEDGARLIRQIRFAVQQIAKTSSDPAELRERLKEYFNSIDLRALIQ